MSYYHVSADGTIHITDRQIDPDEVKSWKSACDRKPIILNCPSAEVAKTYLDNFKQHLLQSLMAEMEA
jgi:hypothetical protein